ncbi:MAG: alpha-amylase [Bacteroidales bacterium]|nr:alpha-amylase [Bacteroidales bacterium]
MIRKYIPLVAALVLAFSCNPTTEPTVQDTLTVSPASLSFEAEDASVKLVYVTTAGDWTASLSDNWMHLEKSSGTGKGTLALKVDANTGEDRTGTLTVKGASTATVSVTQKGKNIVQIVPVADAFDGTKRASTTYQLLIYSFADSNGDGIGDFKGIQDRLDYLDGLGVTALWLSPAHPTSSYHAYDVDDYSTVNPLYGSEQDFKNLIDAAHGKGIKIYMDYVLNHSGRNNAWFQQALADPASPYREYYVFSDDPESDVRAGKIDNYGGASSPGMGSWHQVASGSAGYAGRLHFVLNSTAKTITVTETTAPADTPLATADWYIYNNDFQGMKKTADGMYEITLDMNNDWGFLVCSKKDWSSGSKYGASSSAGNIQFGVPFSLYTNANNDAVGNIRFGGTSTSYFASFDASMPDLNYGKYAQASESPAFQAIAATADRWITDFGVDGFRLDAVLWIYQAQVKANQAFLSQWYDHCNATYKAAGHADDIFMVGEAWESHNTEMQYYKGLTSCFEFEYFDVLARAVNGNASSYVSSVNRFISDHTGQRPDAVTSFHMTNHDQDRAAETFGRDAAKEKQAAAMILTTPGKPFIYQGEELGYYGKKSGGDEYVRTPILWDKAGTQCAKKGVNNKVDTGMLKAEISVVSQTADAGSLLNVYKTWSRLRNTYPALAEGAMTDAGLSGGNSIGAWYMTSGSQKMLVIHNVASSEKSVTVKDNLSKPVALLGSATLDHDVLTLGARSSVVFLL